MMALSRHTLDIGTYFVCMVPVWYGFHFQDHKGDEHTLDETCYKKGLVRLKFVARQPFSSFITLLVFHLLQSIAY